MSFKRTITIITAGIFFISISGCAGGIKSIHPEFKERHKTIKKASIMPPDIEAYVLTFKGDRTPLYDLIPIMEEITIDELEKQFKKKNYEVKKLNLSEEVLNNNPELKTSLFTIKKLFKKTLEDIRKRKQKKFTYSLGSDVNVFAELSDSDILIFIKEDGVKKSAGEIAKDVVKGALISAAALCIGVIYVPIPQTAVTIMHIAIVDSNDGAVLWYRNNLGYMQVDPENKRVLRSAIKGLIRPFPKCAVKDEESVY